MDLFAAAGIQIGDGGRGGRKGRSAVGRTLKLPLLKYKVVAEALKNFTFDFTPQQIEAATHYAKTVRSAKFAGMKETAVRPLFYQKVLGEFLGYTQIDPERPHSLAFELAVGRGSVDVALGRFGAAEGGDEIVAPFELKGPGTVDLDALTPGRGRSPVQQAWEYAVDAPGCRWVLVSNCVEIRLYGFGRGREAYELFDLTKLDERDEQERLWLLLSAERLLGSATEALLHATDSAYKTITDELYKQYSELRGRLLKVLTDSADGPKLALASALEPAQKILDRILFIAFAQRTALLPDRLLELAVKTKNPIRPEPIWQNFIGLFRGVEKGNPALNIWPYNGGLFLHDPVADAIELPDALAEDLAKLGEWDYRDDVPVTLLGHLFEQSITDLEKLRAESRGEAAPKVSKRKREGVVYTPDIVTRFLVDRTIGLTLAERRAALLAKHGRMAPDNGDPIFAENEQEAERALWRDYVASLRDLRIVDPACGSGAFLVAAFDLLASEYRSVVERLHALGEPIDFDPFDEIVTKNLYGVDLNAESVEITRLALWLKTARSQHRLQNLETTIKVGNSLIDDPKFTEHPFDWRAAFPDVFAQGGFDIVIGNPPYVRMELIKPVKPYLEEHYSIYDGSADLYTYFFERGCEILKNGGRLGYITSLSFFRTGFGRHLRTYLAEKTSIEAIIDFGDTHVFEDVTTYPAAITFQKSGPKEGHIKFQRLGTVLPTDLVSTFAKSSVAMPRVALGTGSWQLEDDALAALRRKIRAGRPTLKDIGKRPLYGAKTGANDVFIISGRERSELCRLDPRSSEVIKPLLTGDDLHRWGFHYRDTFLIFANASDIEVYPAVRDYLSKFRTELEPKPKDWQPLRSGERWPGRKTGNYKWYELQDTVAYASAFESPKVIYPEFSQGPKFSFDSGGHFLTNKCFMIAGDLADTAYLNSKLVWFFLFGESAQMRGGQWRLELRTQYVETIPAMHPGPVQHDNLSSLAQRCQTSRFRRGAAEAAVHHRILTDLAVAAPTKRSRKLDEWWTLDFGTFRDEVKRAFRVEIPVKERDEWEAYLAQHAAEIRSVDDEIEQAEREIDAIVYRLFALTPEEIALLEASIVGQY